METLMLVTFFAVILLVFFLFNAHSKLAEQKKIIAKFKEKYEPILDIEAEVNKVEKHLLKVQKELKEIRDVYKEKRPVFDELIKQIAIYDEKIALHELGIYEPSFQYTDSEDFKYKIQSVKERQKSLVSAEQAVIATTQWTVDGSVAKGATLTKRAIRLTLRAFNNECEAAISNIKWNNANAMLKRIENAKRQIDKANKSSHILITQDFLDLKITELKLTHEYREKQKEEREKSRDIARQEREERTLLKEAEHARKEEEKYQRLLEKVRAEVGVMTLEQHQEKMSELQKLLDEAHEKYERAQSMAEKTKSGFVYIVSNIGAFGEDVVKIGLTRRVDPFDRVKELGDASVPFVFDTHAMIYSEQAPDLEQALHEEFAERRINMSNFRKEFFKVTLDEVEAAVKKLAPEAEFFKDIEAREFRETVLMRKTALKDETERKGRDFPLEL